VPWSTVGRWPAVRKTDWLRVSWQQAAWQRQFGNVFDAVVAPDRQCGLGAGWTGTLGVNWQRAKCIDDQGRALTQDQYQNPLTFSGQTSDTMMLALLRAVYKCVVWQALQGFSSFSTCALRVCVFWWRQQPGVAVAPAVAVHRAKHRWWCPWSRLSRCDRSGSISIVSGFGVNTRCQWGHTA
jgi:hypothetical protein